MPTYDYACPQGHRFEVFQKMSDEPVAQCPECGESAERQISGGAGFLFQGEGFYITDYRSEEYKKKASSETGEAKPKSEPKPEPKSESKSGGGEGAASSSSPTPSDD